MYAKWININILRRDPDSRKKKTPILQSERLPAIGIKWHQLRAPLNHPNIIVLWCSGDPQLDPQDAGRRQSLRQLYVWTLLFFPVFAMYVVRLLNVYLHSRGGITFLVLIVFLQSRLHFEPEMFRVFFIYLMGYEYFIDI